MNADTRLITRKTFIMYTCLLHYRQQFHKHQKPQLSGEQVLDYAWPQLGHKMALSSSRKPCPTSEILHWLQMKQSLCQCRSSNDTNFVHPRPSGINAQRILALPPTWLRTELWYKQGCPFKTLYHTHVQCGLPQKPVSKMSSKGLQTLTKIVINCYITYDL